MGLTPGDFGTGDSGVPAHPGGRGGSRSIRNKTSRKYRRQEKVGVGYTLPSRQERFIYSCTSARHFYNMGGDQPSQHWLL
jgi:hypothetical protein